MNEFERTLPPYRLVETNHADTLQSIAHREMGDANRWPELVWINALTWPYITDDPQRAGPGVLLSGQFIKIPAPTGVFTDDAERGQVYERDAKMMARKIVIADGDFAVVAGADNLRQQLQHRIDTPRGQARRHPEYGCMLSRLKGAVNGPVAAMLGAEYVKAALLADYRVSAVDIATGEVVGDAVRVTARARPIEGGIVDLLTSS